MLTDLTISNFALIENCEISFDKGLNIITGETGAGKSILIQALTILLGGRASVDQIRTGYNEAILNASIDISAHAELKEELRDCGIIIEDDEVILRRVLNSSGKSRSFINGNPVTSKELQIVSNALFDFHGQHDGVSLLRKNTHLGYFDSFAGFEPLFNETKTLFQEIKRLNESLKSIEKSDTDKEKRIELLTFEVDEISAAAIKEGEDTLLENEINILTNREKITAKLSELTGILSGTDGVISSIKGAKNVLSSLAEMDRSYNKMLNGFSDAFYQLEDITQEIVHNATSIDNETGDLDKMIERYELISKLKRKYGDSIKKIYEYRQRAENELELINFSDKKIAEYKENIELLKKRYIEKALILSDKRQSMKTELEKKVVGVLKYLGMERAEFSVNISFEPAGAGDEYIEYNNQRIKYFETGLDCVEFMISPNIGEPLKSLSKIASGGELSRIILSLKTILCESDKINTMIFDEIDSGIGGKVALAVSRALRKLGKSKQIICITHLAQVAASGAHR